MLTSLFQWQTLLVIGIVLLVMFGSALLPRLAKSLGNSARILKTELREARQDGGVRE